MTIALPLIKGYTGILVFAVVYGVGDGIFITTMNSLLMFTVDEKRRAAALGLGSCLLSLGIAGGAPLAGKRLFPDSFTIFQFGQRKKIQLTSLLRYGHLHNTKSVLG